MMCLPVTNITNPTIIYSIFNLMLKVSQTTKSDLLCPVNTLLQYSMALVCSMLFNCLYSRRITPILREEMFRRWLVLAVNKPLLLYAQVQRLFSLQSPVSVLQTKKHGSQSTSGHMITIQRQHMDEALSSLQPSVSEAERRRYLAM